MKRITESKLSGYLNWAMSEFYFLVFEQITKRAPCVLRVWPQRVNSTRNQHWIERLVTSQNNLIYRLISRCFCLYWILWTIAQQNETLGNSMFISYYWAASLEDVTARAPLNAPDNNDLQRSIAFFQWPHYYQHYYFF